MKPAVAQAARWLATMPRHEIEGTLALAIQERLDLTVVQAVEAVREANLIRARAM